MTIKRFEVPDWIRSVLICDPTDIWGNVVGMGLAELSAVLSPARRFDRRGNVFFVDTFEDGLGKWAKIVTGTGAAVEISTTYSLFGAFSAKATGGSDSTRYGGIQHRQYYPSATPLGFEIAFTLNELIEYIYWKMEAYTGTRWVRATVRWEQVTGALEYQDGAGVFQSLAADLWLSLQPENFHVAKTVFDPAGEKYLRFLSDNNEYDMSAIALLASDSSTAPYVLSSSWIVSESGQNAAVYYDDVVLTQNEPA